MDLHNAQSNTTMRYPHDWVYGETSGEPQSRHNPNTCRLNWAYRLIHADLLRVRTRQRAFEDCEKRLNVRKTSLSRRLGTHYALLQHFGRRSDRDLPCALYEQHSSQIGYSYCCSFDYSEPSHHNQPHRRNRCFEPQCVVLSISGSSDNVHTMTVIGDNNTVLQ